jgi:hypothetical protein
MSRVEVNRLGHFAARSDIRVVVAHVFWVTAASMESDLC